MPLYSHGVGEVQLASVDGEVDVAEHAKMKPRGGNDDVGLQLAPRFEQDAVVREALDCVGNHRSFAARDRLEQIAVRDQRDTLPPRAV
jgi:hypothetical protein